MISKIIELETLTPLFIKGKDLNYGEGMLRGSDGVVYLIDNDKLCEYIAENKKIEEYALEYDIKNRRSDLNSFLKRNNIYPNDIELRDIAKGITEISEKAPYDDEKQKINFIQNGRKNPFIPGTSLKGAVRNAVIWRLLKEKKYSSFLTDLFVGKRASLDNELHGVALISNALEKAKKQDFESADKIMSSLHNSSFQEKDYFLRAKDDDGHFIYYDKKNSIQKKLNDYQKGFAKNFTYNLFQDKRLIFSVLNLEKIPQARQDLFYISKKDFDERWQYVKRNKSIVDFFRIIKISDCNIVQDTSLNWLQAKTVCKDNVGQVYKKYHTNTLECIPKKIKAVFKITINTHLAKMFFSEGLPDYFQSVENLLSVVNDYYRAIAHYEEADYYRGAISISVDEKSSDKDKVKLRVNTSDVWELYKSTFGLQSEEILFRTGWGGGFMSKTQFLHLDISDRRRVRDMIHYNGSTLAPKSRCLIVEGQNATEPLGWCKLRVLGDAIDMPLPSIDAAIIKAELITQQNKQNRKGNYINSGKTLTEREIKESKEEAKAILKQAEKRNVTAPQLLYRNEQIVNATVEECIPFTSVKVKVDKQFLTINSNILKQKGEIVKIKIIEIENGNIVAAKLL